VPKRALAQAALVDIEDDHPRVHAARHGDREPPVVNDVVEPADQADVVQLGGMAGEQEHQREAERDPDNVFFQAMSLLFQGWQVRA